MKILTQINPPPPRADLSLLKVVKSAHQTSALQILLIRIELYGWFRVSVQCSWFWVENRVYANVGNSWEQICVTAGTEEERCLAAGGE